MTFNLVKVFQEMGFFARCIVGTLTLMAVACLAVLVERLWAFAKYRRNARRFAAIALPYLDRREYHTLLAESQVFTGTPLFTMISAGLTTYLDALRKTDLAISPVELAKRELARKTELLGVQVRRGMSVLASVGSVAPFVGLLGTVVGIISAFQGIAKEGSGGLGAVSSGIAEALVVTALGLVVAIPAVLAFNFLSTRADAILLALDQSRGEFLDHIESTPLVVNLNSHAHANGRAHGAETRANGSDVRVA